MTWPTATAVLTPRGAQRWLTGHPWIFRSDVESVSEGTGRETLARVTDRRGRVLGHALLSRSSQITLRILRRGPEPPDENLLRRRLRRARDYRAERGLGDRDAVRLVFGESDGLPGLVADRYGEHLVVQLLSSSMDGLREELVPLLVEEFGVASILARHDVGVRKLEGLPLDVETLYGDPPDTVPYHEGDLVFTAGIRHGQKTGAFLDQVDNHLRVGQLARGRVLDAFSYGGGFGLAAARGGAEEVICVDSSGEAVARITEAAAANGAANVTPLEANVFDYLRERHRGGDVFDLVVLDPPAFAKNKRELEGALRGYKEINLRAMKILRPGGMLVTCSCSYQLTEDLFDQVLAQAAADARRAFRVVERRDQAPDHPVRVGFAESRYLKCLVLEMMD